MSSRSGQTFRGNWRYNRNRGVNEFIPSEDGTDWGVPFSEQRPASSSSEYAGPRTPSRDITRFPLRQQQSDDSVEEMSVGGMQFPTAPRQVNPYPPQVNPRQTPRGDYRPMQPTAGTPTGMGSSPPGYIPQNFQDLPSSGDYQHMVQQSPRPQSQGSDDSYRPMSPTPPSAAESRAEIFTYREFVPASLWPTVQSQRTTPRQLERIATMARNASIASQQPGSTNQGRR